MPYSLKLNYPIHVPIFPADDFNADLASNEIDQVVILKKLLDISNKNKVSVLSVSLHTIGSQRVDKIQNRGSRYQIPYEANELDHCDQMKKQELPHEGPFYRYNYCRKTYSEALNGNSKLSFDFNRIPRNPSIPYQTKSVKGIFWFLFHFPSRTFENTTPINNNQSVDGVDHSEQQPSALQHLDCLSTTSVLKLYCISVYDTNCKGAFLKHYSSLAKKHLDLLYDSNNRHNVITSMKALLPMDAWSLDNPVAQTEKDLSISLPYLAVNLGDPRFQCYRCHSMLQSCNSLQGDFISGVCHLYTQCPSCNNAVPKSVFQTFSKSVGTFVRFISPFSDMKNNCDLSASQHQCLV